MTKQSKCGWFTGRSFCSRLASTSTGFDAPGKCGFLTNRDGDLSSKQRLSILVLCHTFLLGVIQVCLEPERGCQPAERSLWTVVVYLLCVSSAIFVKQRLSCLVVCFVFCSDLLWRILHLKVANGSKMIGFYCYFSLFTARLVMPLVKNDRLCSFQNAESTAVITASLTDNCLRFGFQLF